MSATMELLIGEPKHNDVALQLQPTTPPEPTPQGGNFESFLGRFQVDFESIAILRSGPGKRNQRKVSS